MREAIFLVLGTTLLIVGGMSVFAIWSCVPVLIGYFLLRRAERKALKPAPETAYNVVSTGVLLAAGAAMTGDANFGRGSSTAGLVFVFIPVWAMVLGGVAFVATWVFTKRC